MSVSWSRLKLEAAMPVVPTAETAVATRTVVENWGRRPARGRAATPAVYQMAILKKKIWCWRRMEKTNWTAN
jgi:hypothetical protein